MNEIKQLVDPKNHEKFDKKIPNKQFLLGKYYDATLSSFMKAKHNCSHKAFPKSKTQKMLAGQMKISEQVLGKQKYESDKMKYEFYLPLNSLWQRYMRDLIEKETNQETREMRVLRGDFYGAYITVLDSNNETLVGAAGIVIRQTLRTFEIILDPNPSFQQQQQQANQMQDEAQEQFFQPQKTPTRNKPIIKIQKSICIFLISVGSQSTFVLNGSSLVYRPSDRIRHKFKVKKGQKLNFKFLQTLSQVKQQLNL